MIVYGRNIIKEAIQADYPISEIRVTEEANREMADLIGGAAKSGTRVKIVKNSELDSFTKGGVHQGIAAWIKDFEDSSIDDILKAEPDNGPIVILDQVQDVHNLGAIARTAFAAGAKGIVLTERRSAPISPAAVKAGAGAFFHLKTAHVANLSRLIEQLKEAGYWIYGADAGGESSLYEVEFAPHSAVVFGGEEKGLRHLIRSKCDVIFKIPMAARTNSLNVSVAAAVVLYEILRQK